MRGSRRTIRTPKIRVAVLDALTRGWSVHGACKQAGIGTRTYYDWRDADPVFRADADAAMEAATDTLEDMARQRALQHSDLLLIFLLRSRPPHIYNRKQTIAIGGDPDAPPITDHLLAVASGRGGDVPRSTRAAPANIDTWTMNVNDAIDRVLLAEASQQAQTVIAVAHKARVDLVRGVLLAQFLAARNLVQTNQLGGLHLLSQYPLTDNYDRERSVATASWRAVVERLASDADAVIDLG